MLAASHNRAAAIFNLFTADKKKFGKQTRI